LTRYRVKRYSAAAMIKTATILNRRRRPFRAALAFDRI
jgi:hypothetical protein